MRTIGNLILILFSAFTLLLTVCYLMLLEEKILEHHVKNLNNRDYDRQCNNCTHYRSKHLYSQEILEKAVKLNC